MDTKTHDEPSHNTSDENSGPDVRLAAKNYKEERGWETISLQPGSKKPVAKNWQKAKSADDGTGWPGNIGVLLGEPSGGLVDIDLDCDEARRLAPIVLPPTGLKHGRASSPNSHWYYACGVEAPAAASTGIFLAPGFGEGKDKPMLELRSTGGQTMVPPSIHPNGERLTWAAFDEPAKIGVGQLQRAVRVLAAAALMYRHFPEKGSRENAYAAMIGTLLRGGVPVDTVEGIVSTFTGFTDADQPRTAGDRVRRVVQLATRLEKKDGKVPGLPKLAEVFGKDAAKRVREWLFDGGDWAVDGKGQPLRNALHNIVLALDRLEVKLRFDEFAGKCLVKIDDAAEAELSDHLANRLWFQIEEEFNFSPDLDKFCRALQDKGRQNRFHPVRDYLAGLRWDGKTRLDTWLFDYGGVPRADGDDDRYIEAVGRLMLVAAVRRIRQPGVKFDEMLVLINETQGTDKSTALATLAVQPEWFTDSVYLGADDKKVIEQTAGKWIAEIPELKGRGNEIDHIKAFLSRQADRARLAYARFTTEVGRSFVLFGTTNDRRFLLDTTGNRRFWPVVGVKFDVATLKRDVDQLWAEAAAAEAAGESIRLAPELWSIAEKMQGGALVDDPWCDVLHAALHDLEGRIRGVDIWNILGIAERQRRQYDNERMGRAMKLLGWARPENTIRFRDGTARGYLKGDGKDEVVVNITTDEHNREMRTVMIRIGDPPRVKVQRYLENGVEVKMADEKRF